MYENGVQPLEVTRIDSAASLEALNRSESDIQIVTAKKYPRDVKRCLEQIVALATVNPATAAECYYSLRRKGADGETVIEGPSVRLAEIVATSWKNIRAGSQIIGNDGKFITARGVCWDLENNVAVTCEVKRGITNKMGRTYSEDMQVVTGNAAGAIAFRNAVFKVVPKAMISEASNAIKASLTQGVAQDFDAQKEKMFGWFLQKGVTREMIYAYFDVSSDADITPELVAELRTVATAINEKQATIKELFIDPYEAIQAEKAKEATGRGPKGVKERMAEARKAQEAAIAGEQYAAPGEGEDMPSDLGL